MSFQYLRDGETCWRTARADAVSFLVDGADFFAAAKSAMLSAKHSIWLLAWTFDPLTRMQPDLIERSGDPETPDRLGLLLARTAALNPALDVRVLAWNMPWPIAAPGGFAHRRSQMYFHDTKVKYRLDSSLPASACHHQKVLVIDGRLAFVSGGDLSTDRWDTCGHEDADPRRRLPNLHRYPARHDVSVMVTGPAALECAQLFADRWSNAGGGRLDIPEPDMTEETPWPRGVAPDMIRQRIALVRTQPKWRDNPEIDEGLDLHLAVVMGARKTLYIENQYLTAATVVEAICRRLAEPDGPEVIAIGPAASPSFFDRMTMDSARAAGILKLTAADVHGRFKAFNARTHAGKPIIVHSKVLIADDDFLRIGSANLNNRSGGLDTEVDLAMEAEPGEAGAEARETIVTFRNLLIGHYVDRNLLEVEAAIAEAGGLIGAIELLDVAKPRRLCPVECRTLSPIEKFVSDWSLGDPVSPSDAWRPWIRRRRLREQLALIPAPRSPAPPPAADDPMPPVRARRTATPRT